MKQFINEFNFDPRDPPHTAVMLREGEEEDSDMIVVELSMPIGPWLASSSKEELDTA